MNPAAGWIVAAVLAVILLALPVFAGPLARLFGYEIGRPAPRLAGRDEPRNGAAPADDGGETAGASGRNGGPLDFDELEVSDVMVHRTAIRMLNADDPPAEIVAQILQSPHTRKPLWRGSTDNIVGVLHAKELLRALHEAGNDPGKLDILKVASKPWFVPDTTALRDQLSAFLRRKARFAIVVDEYGELQGIVTLEDIVELIVGDIADEKDIDIQGVKQESDGSVLVDGTASIRDLNRVLGWKLPDEEATTIAGLVIHEAQAIPEEKQAFTFHGKRFVVMKRERNRIARLRIKAQDSAPAPRLPAGGRKPA